jgi:hypothetical protein
MLRVALRFANDPAAFDTNGADANRLRELQARQWPASGIPIPGNDLASRDPQQAPRGLLEKLRSWRQRPSEPLPEVQNNEDLEAFERLPKLAPEFDPLTSRPPKRVLAPTDLDGVYGLAQLFTAADLDTLNRATGSSPQQIDAAVDHLPDSLFAPVPFARVKTLQALLSPAVLATAKTAQPVPGYCCLDTQEMSPPVVSGVPPLALAPGSPLEPFEKHCFACHRGNPAKRLNFMAGASESEVLETIKAKSEIRDALDWTRYRGTDKENKLMPPADSTQRAALEAELKQNPKLLEEMRNVVPGMFDF